MQRLVAHYRRLMMDMKTERQLRQELAELWALLQAEREVNAALREDAERLNWLRDNLFEHKWNGVVGKGCAVQWQVAPDFRFKQRELTDDSGIMAGDFRRAINAAMAASPGAGAA